VLDVLEAIAKQTGKSIPQIALNWLVQRPTVASVIIGARNEQQLRENLGTLGWKLTADQIARLDEVSQTTPSYPYWHQMQFASDRNPPLIPVRIGPDGDHAQAAPATRNSTTRN
jgi:diketogulonate reductase-like aldo/keto reductase